jgi:hypothetical protein
MYGIVRDERMVVDNDAGPQDERRWRWKSQKDE